MKSRSVPTAPSLQHWSRALAPGLLCLAVLGAAPEVAPAAPAPPSEPTGLALQANRPDQVFERSRRSVRPVAGEVVAARLDGVVISVGGRERTIDASDVVRVQLNRVPQTFRDGLSLSSSGSHAAAAEAFLEAAGDRDASEPARAAARHRAAASLLRATAADPDRARQAVSEAERFLSDHGENREAPEVRLLLGRAQWLAGDARSAASTFESLFREAAGAEATTGYPLEICYEAGLLGARAALVGGDRAKAEELFAGLESGLPAAVGSLEPEDPRVATLEHLRAAAQLGEGHVLLAAGRAAQARSFFQARLDAGEVASVRSAARLGLAQALEAEGQLRPAQVLYAQVSATAADSGDVVAAALVGLARTAMATAETGGRARARAWLEAVRDRHGDSLSARDAHEALSSL